MGFFKKLGKGLKKAAGGVTKAAKQAKRGISSVVGKPLDVVAGAVEKAVKTAADKTLNNAIGRELKGAVKGGLKLAAKATDVGTYTSVLNKIGVPKEITNVVNMAATVGLNVYTGGAYGQAQASIKAAQSIASGNIKGVVKDLAKAAANEASSGIMSKFEQAQTLDKYATQINQMKEIGEKAKTAYSKAKELEKQYQQGKAMYNKFKDPTALRDTLAKEMINQVMDKTDLVDRYGNLPIVKQVQRLKRLAEGDVGADEEQSLGARAGSFLARRAAGTARRFGTSLAQRAQKFDEEVSQAISGEMQVDDEDPEETVEDLHVEAQSGAPNMNPIFKNRGFFGGRRGGFGGFDQAGARKRILKRMPGFGGFNFNRRTRGVMF
jgi:hypothetical protein